MALTWNYPETATLRVNNTLDENGYLITDGETVPNSQKAVTFKGYKTPDDNEDANAATSTYRAFTTVIYGLFGLGEGLVLNSGVSQANAELDGELE